MQLSPAVFNWAFQLFNYIPKHLHMRKITLFLLCQMLLLLTAFAQERTITGKITDDTGSPIPNASEMVKGTTTGTITRADGTFSLTIRSNAKTLVVSSVNFDDQQLSI